MNKIVIIGEYPTESNIKDGMIRRIHQIDKELKNCQKIYLNIKFLSNYKKKIIENKNLKIYNINFFKDFKLIKKILNNNNKIYIHSLLNFTRVFILLNKNNEIILDTHGAVVEEMEFHNKKIKVFILKFLEKYLFYRLKKVIFVNNSMKEFFFKKYPNLLKKDFLIYPIIELKNKKIENYDLELSEDTVNIIYSGNLQKWQNIDLMLKTLKKIENKNYKYIFLTGQISEFQKKLDEYCLKNYILKSVLPEELGYYYSKCDYGILLRDSHILNKVANPTKLGEYMEYGIVPIVKYEDIGDYLELGYEYLNIENLNTNLKKIRSNKNKDIILNLKNSTKKINLKKFIWN